MMIMMTDVNHLTIKLMSTVLLQPRGMIPHLSGLFTLYLWAAEADEVSLFISRYCNICHLHFNVSV